MKTRNRTRTFNIIILYTSASLLFFGSCSSDELFEMDPMQHAFVAATYNIRLAVQEDEAAGNGWDIRKGHIKDVILNHQMDIIGTQEGNAEQLSDLDSLLEGYSYHAHPYGGIDNGWLHNLAIFYKSNIFTLIESGVFWLSPTPDQPSFGWDATDRRICQWGKFLHQPSGKEFYYFNTHFFWQGITAKQGSGLVITSKIKSIAKDAPVILGGDMNSDSISYQMMVIKELLEDSYASGNNDHEGIQETAFPGGTFQGTPVSRIDYVYTNQFVHILDYKVGTDTYKNVDNEDTYPSDHLPVICKINIE